MLILARFLKIILRVPGEEVAKTEVVRCYFLRHGIAEDPEQWPGKDFDRPLTGAGKDRMAREAKTIVALAPGCDAILTSPLLRAKQTAAIVAKALKMPYIEDPRLGLGFNARALADVLAEHADAEALLLVGHEPSMSTTIGEIVGGARIDLKKGALACVNFAKSSSLTGVLVWLVPPKILAL